MSLEFMCNNGHKHNIVWHSFKQGVSCGKCINNHGTSPCMTHLDKLELVYAKEKKYKECKHILESPFDLFVNNTFLIEYDGEQHF